MKRILVTVLVLVLGCGDDGTNPGGSGGSGGSSGSGGSGGTGGMSGTGGTGGTGATGGTGGTGATGGTGGSGGQPTSCTPGMYRCNGTEVEICNSSGTAFLYVSSCQVACMNGLCSGGCTAGETRCNGNTVESCRSDGTGFDAIQTCSATFCSQGQCARNGLEITSNTDLNGLIIVQGTLVVRSGATLSSSSGNLTIRADVISVENGASIGVAPAGHNPTGQGADGRFCSGGFNGGAGGSYATSGTIGPTGSSGFPCISSPPIYGSNTHAAVEAGSAGGGVSGSTTPGGAGGGVLRLIASQSITVAGQITANGAPGTVAAGNSGLSTGGGSGGGILLAADAVTVTGSISAVGAGTSGNWGGVGGNGRVRVLFGATHSITGTLSGTVTQGLLPPLDLTSSTHPALGR